MSLNNIGLADSDKSALVRLCRGKSASGAGSAAEINYKEAIAMLNVNYPEGADESDPFSKPWTIRPN